MRKIIEAFLDLIYKKKCYFCKSSKYSLKMCPSCYNELSYSDFCPNRIINGVNIYACGIYEKILQKLIRGLKYHKQRELAFYLAKFMYDYWLNINDKREFTESSKRDTNVNRKAKDKQTETLGNRPQESKKLSKSDALPNYTSDELSEILETRADAAMLINECQKIMGKIFNVHEINKIIGLSDYLALDSEYILLLVKYCAESGRKTLHYVEKTAFSLYDIGITGVDELAS